MKNKKDVHKLKVIVDSKVVGYTSETVNQYRKVFEKLAK